MGAIPKSLINFDARTKIFLLIAVSAFIFTNANHIAETILRKRYINTRNALNPV